MKSISKIFILALFAGLGLGELCAQSILDPYHFAGSSPTGTARFTALGGAFASVGGDASGVGLNPAGAGLFLNRQFDVSLGLNTAGSSILNQSDFTGEIGLPAASVIFHFPVANNKWKAVNVGFSSSRTSSHSRTLAFDQKTNAPNSMVDFFLAQANGIPVENLESESFFGFMAFQTFIIDTLPGSNDQYGTQAQGESRQFIEQTRRGKSSDVDFSVSGNYDNRLYVGVSLGFSNFSVNDEFLNVEDFENSSLNKVTFNDENQRDGGAFNFKIGAIFRPIEALRIGAYYHAPKLYRLSSNYNAYAASEFTDGAEYSLREPFAEYLYRFKIPSKYGFGVSYILGKMALISMDFEQMQLQKSYFAALSALPGEGADKSFYRQENLTMATSYIPLTTVRAGLELKFNNFYVRGGVHYQSNPLEDSFSDFTDRTTYTGGLGLRLKTMSLDLYTSYTQNTEGYLPYDGAVLQTVKYNALNFGAGASFFF